MWLERAALRPLRLFLSNPQALHSFTADRLRDIIYGYAHRLKYIELEMGQGTIGLLRLNSVPFPLLRHAVLLGASLSDNPHSSNPVSVYNDAPQLRQLTVLGGTELSYYAPPFLQLTHYEGPISEQYHIRASSKSSSSEVFPAMAGLCSRFDYTSSVFTVFNNTRIIPSRLVRYIRHITTPDPARAPILGSFGHREFWLE